MAERKDVQTVVYRAVADAFMVDVASIEADPTKRLREDMGATSMQYFPIISALEDEFDLDIDLHDFQNGTRSIEDAVDFVLNRLGD